jgi:hypothetical protein
MKYKGLSAVSLFPACIIGLLSANCGLFDGKSSPDGGLGGSRPGSGGTGGRSGCGFGGATYGQSSCTDAAVATCNSMVFDNGNTAAWNCRRTRACSR